MIALSGFHDKYVLVCKYRHFPCSASVPADRRLHLNRRLNVLLSALAPGATPARQVGTETCHPMPLCTCDCLLFLSVHVTASSSSCPR